jgi:hemophore-related protein
MIALIMREFMRFGRLYVGWQGSGEATKSHINRKSEGNDAMRFNGSRARRVVAGAFATSALGAVLAMAVAPVTNAAPACSAAGFVSTVSSVTAAAGQYLDSHPDANDAFTRAGSQGQGAEASLRTYFVSHPDQYNDLRAIARPLTDLRSQCNSNVGPDQISALLQAFT